MITKKSVAKQSPEKSSLSKEYSSSFKIFYRKDDNESVSWCQLIPQIVSIRCSCVGKEDNDYTG